MRDDAVDPVSSKAPPSTNNSTAAQPTSSNAEGHSQRRGLCVLEGCDVLPSMPDRMRSGAACGEAPCASASSRLGLFDRGSFGSKRNSL